MMSDSIEGEIPKVDADEVIRVLKDALNDLVEGWEPMPEGSAA